MLHLDHFIAVKLGGINCIDNIVPSCKYCNRSKWNEDVMTWYRDQFFFNEEYENKLLIRYNKLLYT
jgi:5-methylcytosine-specific restriction endonuclease McrA